MADTVSRARALTPVSSNPFYMDGPLLIFEERDDTLLDSGLIESVNLPGQRTGCKNKRSAQRVGKEVLSTYRMPDGRVRVTISASLVRQRDTAFVDFLASVNAQVQAVIREAASV